MSENQSEPIHVSPFSGRPQTHMSWDDKGIPAFTVIPDEMTPEGIKLYENLIIAAVVALYAASLGLWYWAKPEGPWPLVAALIAPWVLLRLGENGLYWMLTRKTLVRFTPTEFQVKGKWGWVVYDRTLTHKFVMLRHDKARDEDEQRDVSVRQAARRGAVINPARYYGDSYHIVFEYMGHRHDVLDVYDKNRALAVLARFNACDNVMDNYARLGDGEALHPGAQWGEQPGDLPS